ncbi:hypothetical protein ACFYUJ_26770 [Streptomyces sp. NPDC004520]|uniref:hypothetical protein n=1 Tax=Streptomyces sp. NPDC004520 TaxID=3364702 RepID=UPI0036CE1411
MNHESLPDTVTERQIPEAWQRITDWILRYAALGTGAASPAVTALEDAADMLEAVALVTRDKPGLVGGALVWGSRLDPAQEDRWQPLTG